MRTAPNVFTIEPGLDFARTLVEALLGGHLFELPDRANPLWLADLVLYVPTRRAGRLFEQAFVAAAGDRPAILPDIRPLAEAGDGIEQMLSETDEPQLGKSRRIIAPTERGFRLLPAIQNWQSQLLLRRTERDEAPLHASAAETLALGDTLGRLIDEMAIEGAPLSLLRTITPENFDAARFDDYWSLTREFLAVAADEWPRQLEDLRAEDAIEARLRIIAEEMIRLKTSPPSYPVIIAGSTGSVQATAELMRAVARLPLGAVVLPGLDQVLDADDPEGTWALIGHEKASLPTRFAHPQASLKRTLDIIGMDRTDVVPLGSATLAIAARNRLVSEALRPAETSIRWRETRRDFPVTEALSGLTFVEAADEREEARVIAVLMRQTLENPTARVALVSADRGLARRVGHELERLGIETEDSAGIRLSESGQGMFLRLLLDAATGHGSAPMLAFLRHPTARFGMDGEDLQRLVDALEIFICRKHRFPPTISWVERARAAFEREPRPRWPWGAAFNAESQMNLTRFCAHLDGFFAPLSRRGIAVPLQEQIATLARMLDEAREGSEADTDEIARMDLVLNELAELGGSLAVKPRELGDVIEQALQRVVLPPAGETRRAQILGFLEARLLSADRVIIGGLNEGSVPPAVAGDPLLNRAMRLGLGLQPGERRIGQSAHDFAMLAGNSDLVLTRSERVGTSPGTPSRFLKRLEAFAGIETWKEHVRAPGQAMLAAIRKADFPGARASINPPAIVPQRPRLPPTVSITDFESLRRDPYAIYARKLLRLPHLELLDPAPDARHRGTLLHKVLERFVRERVEMEAESAGQRLRDIAAEEFRFLAHEPEAFQFWWNAFENVADGFVAFDARARAEGARIFVETYADYRVSLPQDESLRITGKADRIEMDAEGFVSIIDYKSGNPPGWGQIKLGLAPQLPLTAALLREGGFAELPPVTGIRSIAYLPIGGGKKLVPGLTGKDPPPLEQAIDETWRAAHEQLRNFANGETGYRSRLKPLRVNDAGDYDHLARVGEWSLGAPDEEESAEDDE